MPNTFKTLEENLHFEGILDIDPSEVNERSSELCLIDVRQPDEFTGELGHIPGAKLIVLDVLPENLNDVPRNKPVIFVCRSGGRSARAAAFAKQNGFENVYNMKGGMILWKEQRLPTEE